MRDIKVEIIEEPKVLSQKEITGIEKERIIALNTQSTDLTATPPRGKSVKYGKDDDTGFTFRIEIDSSF